MRGSLLLFSGGFPGGFFFVAPFAGTIALLLPQHPTGTDTFQY
jgi:hypothetical protein